jgi:hypothetical protein
MPIIDADGQWYEAGAELSGRVAGSSRRIVRAGKSVEETKKPGCGEQAGLVS